MIDQLEDQ